MSVKRVAVIGLGAMGSPIAHRLLGTGCRIIVWNRSPQRAKQAARRRGAIETDEYPARFALALARKDVGLVAAR